MAYGTLIWRNRIRGPLVAILVASAFQTVSVAQSNDRQCANSFAGFEELYTSVLRQINEDESKSSIDVEALNRHRQRYKEVVEAGRQHLSDCAGWGTRDHQVDVLEGIGQGLIELGEPEDSIPIFKRCVALKSDQASCWYALGDAYFRTCQFDEAKKAYSAILEIGGFDQQTAKYLEFAKSELSRMDSLSPEQWKGWRQLYQCPDNPTDKQASRFGTGFFISKQGYILTNDHVIKGCRTLKTSEGKSLVVVDRDSSADLALIKMDGTPDAVAAFRSGPAPRAGDSVFAFGFPLPGVLTSQGNISSGIISATSGVNDDVRFVQISAPVQPGNSGGPLLDASGNVIGVVVAKLDALNMARLTGDVPQNVNFAVHWTEVNAFLDKEGISVARKPSLIKPDPNKIAASAKSFSLEIECTE